MTGPGPGSDAKTDGNSPGERSSSSDGSGAREDGPMARPDEPVKESSRPNLTLPEAAPAGRREIAPAISPLIVGFTLLLVLISLLGYLSVKRMEGVSTAVYESQRNHAGKLRLLLEMRLAVTKLNNEARARHDAESRGGLKPPFDFRFRSARSEVNDLLRELQRPPISKDWGQFRQDLQAFVEVTEDLRRYSLEGFDKFEVVDKELDRLLASSLSEQDVLFGASIRMQQDAAQSIRRWNFIALIVGTIVAAGTIWEVQRRFRQTRRSMFEARRERTFTTQLLEGMVSAVVAIDHNDRIRSANAAFFKIFPGASIGASVFEKFGADEDMKMLEAVTAVRPTTATYRGRWVSHVGDGDHHEKTFDIYTSPLAIDGNQGQIVTLVDATEAVEAERGLRRSESLAAVGQATAQVAHEIRNPLGSIRLGVSMLRDVVKEPEALNTIQLVERGIHHLNKLVVDVTQYSRQKALERGRVDLHELLERSLDLVTESIQEKRTRVVKSFSSQQFVGNWDGHQLRQVFVNVISNAVDASPAESTITISTDQVTLNGGPGGHARSYARIAVQDLGQGIDATQFERIFEPFFSTKKRGTGLGLAIVKQIV
ncbi:MAG: two-component system sensor histidine kinase NtrB, partial [Pyrinomonadaceae bacterium]